MVWMVFLIFAVVLAAGLLVALRRYERESASAALREVEALHARIDDLTRRLQNLEAIAAAEDVPAGAPPEAAAPEMPLPDAPAQRAAPSDVPFVSSRQPRPPQRS